MSWVLLETNQSHPHHRQLPLPPPPPPPPLSSGRLDSNISPSILLIILILAVIFFISGLLHLIVRYLLRPTNGDHEEPDNVTALQGQLQQLFHLHDAGVDQSFIDTLPIFLYKAIIGLKDPFDCAVCLCEFENDDKLRLLPKCSHAFHLECIDTWLLSHSNCPLCRSSLLPDFSSNNCCSPTVLALESGSESSRESDSDMGDREPGLNAHLGPHGEEDLGSSTIDAPQKTEETGAKEEAGPAVPEAPEAKVVPVKLGKFRNVDAGAGGGEGSSGNNSSLDERRCFSMGSFEYVMDETSLLQVAIKPPTKKKQSVKMPGHRLAMSECDCHSRREGFKGFDASTISTEMRADGDNAHISSNSNQRESFSISKIWLQSKKQLIADDGSRRAFSFRFPLHRGGRSEESKQKCGGSSSWRTASSEFDFAGWDKNRSELGFDVEIGSCNNGVISRTEETPSFARKTLLWIVGWHHKVVNQV